MKKEKIIIYKKNVFNFEKLYVALITLHSNIQESLLAKPVCTNG